MTTRSASPGPEPEAEAASHRQQLAQLRLDDTTLPRARFILDQQQAILRDTPYNQGCIRATAEYVCALEAGAEAEPEPEAEL
jgi:hypothetical protein